MIISVKNIFIYPVKSLGAVSCKKITVTKHKTLPHDRQWAIAHAGSNIDPIHPQWHHKRHFITIFSDQSLGELTADYDDDTAIFTIKRKGRAVAHGDLQTQSGRMVLETFLNGYFVQNHRQKLQLFHSGNHGHLCDDMRPLISLLNLNSVYDIAHKMGSQIDPHRFRANLWSDDLPAWAERDMINDIVMINNIRFKVVDTITRCRAINVNLDHGNVDINILKALQDSYNHCICGIFLEALDDGVLHPSL